MHEVPRVYTNQDRDERWQRLIALVTSDFTPAGAVGQQSTDNPFLGCDDLPIIDRFGDEGGRELRDELADILISASGTTDSFKHYVGSTVCWAYAKQEPVSARVHPEVLGISNDPTEGIYDVNRSPRIESFMLRAHLADIAALTVSATTVEPPNETLPPLSYVTDPIGFLDGFILLGQWDSELQNLRGHCALAGPTARGQLTRAIGAELRPSLVDTHERFGGVLPLLWQRVRETQAEYRQTRRRS